TSDQAFTGSRGVIQLNQSAGVGNRMANTFSVRVAD
ncbi:adhesin, partial [Pseudomonas sp. MWU12-2312b]